MRILGRNIKASFHGGHHRREAGAGAAVDYLLASDPPLVKDVWIWMLGCYKDVFDPPSPPARVTIERMTSDRVELYCHVPPTGRPIPVEVTPLPVED